MTAVAPGSTAYDGVNEFYASEREYLFAIADALREEYRAIHAAGLIVQVDDPVSRTCTTHSRRRALRAIVQWAQLRVEALNHALRDIPEDRVRYHLCFGSWHVPHTCDAPLEEIVDLVLQVNAGAYLIEAANPRHEHEWRVWEKVGLPEGKILIPGVITHHTVTVEHPRLVVADRIVRFAKIVGRENVIAGTDCGFAQVDHIRSASTRPSCGPSSRRSSTARGWRAGSSGAETAPEARSGLRRPARISARQVGRRSVPARAGRPPSSAPRR